jgi:predicted glycoside hydrolase/deacetylase ChbG (UPF0249 family)
MSEIIILVRADDIGMAQAVNQACIHVYEKGIARSVELMAPCQESDHKLRILLPAPVARRRGERSLHRSRLAAG